MSPTDRAITDLVGYVLMIAVILVGVGLTATVGIDRIEDAQLGGNTDRAVQALELIEGDVDEIQQSMAIVRTSTLSLAAASLSVNASAGPSAVTVNVSGIGDSPTRYPMGALALRLDETTVAVEGGGVFLRSNRGGAVTLAEPSVRCQNGRAIVSLVSLEGPDLNRSFSGGRAAVILRETGTRVLFPENHTGPASLDTATGVNLTVESEFADAWADHLTDGTAQWTRQTGPPTLRVRCGATTEGVVVRQTNVSINVRR